MSLDRSKPIDFGSFSDTAFLGNPGSQRDRQFGNEGVAAGGGNIADEADSGTGIEAVDVKMVPSFMGMSGQGDNQSTNRPKGSV